MPLASTTPNKGCACKPNGLQVSKSIRQLCGDRDISKLSVWGDLCFCHQGEDEPDIWLYFAALCYSLAKSHKTIGIKYSAFFQFFPHCHLLHFENVTFGTTRHMYENASPFIRPSHFSLCGFACLANVRLPLIDSLLVHALKINGKNEQLYCNDKQYMICLSSQSQSDKIGIRHEDLYVQCWAHTAFPL